MKHDLAVFIGRFSPFHKAHQAIVEQALGKAEQILMIIGSSFEPRSLRNPWSFEEREDMIRSCFDDAQNKRILCKPLRDIRYNDALWIRDVQKTVYDLCAKDELITLVGSEGEGDLYYPSLFPNWGHLSMPHNRACNGTMIRNHLFENKEAVSVAKYIQPEVSDFLEKFSYGGDGFDLIEEYNFIQKYKKGWENTPFQPTHVTVDSVVVQSGCVLLVERGARPGKGLLSLPGGFIQHAEKLEDAAIRKLKEEAKLKVPEPVLRGSIKNTAIFDDPFRSARGRTITYAFHIELRSEDELPKVKGSGAAKRCFWQPLGRLDSAEMFEDHYFIIQKMLGMV